MASISMVIMQKGTELEWGGLLEGQQESQEKMVKEGKEGVSLKTNKQYAPPSFPPETKHLQRDL